MQPVLAHELAVQLAERLKAHLFHLTTAETQWVNTNGGQQYYLWYEHKLGPSPKALRIEELLDVMWEWNLDWYIRQVFGEWNRIHAPSATKDRSRRIILPYREEQLRHGRTQQLQATQSKAAKRASEQAAAAVRIEHTRWKGLELTIIHTTPAVSQSRLAAGMAVANADAGGSSSIQLPSRTAQRAPADERVRV